MVIKNYVIELAKQLKPEAEVTYEFITVDGINIYTLAWNWKFKGNELKHKLFFCGNESEDIVTIRIHSETDNMKKFEDIELRAELLRREE